MVTLVMALPTLVHGHSSFSSAYLGSCLSLLCSKTVVITNPNCPLGLALFKLVEKNKLSEYYCAPF